MTRLPEKRHHRGKKTITAKKGRGGKSSFKSCIRFTAGTSTVASLGEDTTIGKREKGHSTSDETEDVGGVWVATLHWNAGVKKKV